MMPLPFSVRKAPLGHAVVFGVHRVLFEPLGPHEHERADPDVQRDRGHLRPDLLHVAQDTLREVETGRRRRG
jgi:hypothetical protein